MVSWRHCEAQSRQGESISIPHSPIFQSFITSTTRSLLSSHPPSHHTNLFTRRYGNATKHAQHCSAPPLAASLRALHSSISRRSCGPSTDRCTRCTTPTRVHWGTRLRAILSVTPRLTGSNSAHTRYGWGRGRGRGRGRDGGRYVKNQALTHIAASKWRDGHTCVSTDEQQVYLYCACAPMQSGTP